MVLQTEYPDTFNSVTEFGRERKMWQHSNTRPWPRMGPVHARQLDVELDTSLPTFSQLQLHNLTRTESKDLKVQPTSHCLHYYTSVEFMKQMLIQSGTHI